MLFGIDISTWQKPKLIDYDKIAQQVDFVILRLGYTGSRDGVSWAKDAEFDKHYQEFKKRKVPIGVYWFSRADSPEKGAAEARVVLSLVKDLQLEFPIWWDTEDTTYQNKVSRSVLTATAKAFCSTIEAAGYYVGIYASLSWANTHLNMADLKRYDFWLAQYNDKPTYAGSFGMWQYTSKGRLEGYPHDLDFNKAFKDYGTIIKQAGLNHLKDPEPIIVPKPEPILPPVHIPAPICVFPEEKMREILVQELGKIKITISVGD